MATQGGRVLRSSAAKSSNTSGNKCSELENSELHSTLMNRANSASYNFDKIKGMCSENGAENLIDDTDSITSLHKIIELLHKDLYGAINEIKVLKDENVYLNKRLNEFLELPLSNIGCQRTSDIYLARNVETRNSHEVLQDIIEERSHEEAGNLVINRNLTINTQTSRTDTQKSDDNLQHNVGVSWNESNLRDELSQSRVWETVQYKRGRSLSNIEQINYDKSFPPLRNRFEPLLIHDGSVNDAEPASSTINSRPTEAGITTQKSSKVKKPKIYLYTDSYGRGLSSRLNNDKNLKRFEINGFVKPSACFREVASSVQRDTADFSSDDMVVLIAGANDVSKNNTLDAVKGLKRTLSSLTHTNVVVVNIPHRHELPTWSCVNKEVEKSNERYRDICKHFRNVSTIKVNKCNRSMHTRHGQHFSNIGKDTLCSIITKIIKDRLMNSSKPIPLGFRGDSFLE